MEESSIVRFCKIGNHLVSFFQSNVQLAYQSTVRKKLDVLFIHHKFQDTFFQWFQRSEFSTASSRRRKFICTAAVVPESEQWTIRDPVECAKRYKWQCKYPVG